MPVVFRPSGKGRDVGWRRRVGAEAEGGGGEGCTQFVRCRSRMAIDLRVLTMPARSASDFHRPGGHCLRQARSAVKCSANRMKGDVHRSKNYS